MRPNFRPVFPARRCRPAGGCRTLPWLGLAVLLLAGCVSEEEAISDSTSPPIGGGDPDSLFLVAPPDATAEASGPTTDVALGEPTADGGDGSYTFSNDAPTGGFVPGVTTVRWTVTDGAGAEASDDQLVTVTDTAPPVLEQPADIQTVASGTRTPVSLTPPAATDLVDPAPAVTGDMPAEGFPMGTTAVTWTAEDASGNRATVTQNVTVTEGNAGGPLSLAAPADVAAEATGPTTPIALGTALAGGGTPPYTITNDAPAGGFPLGAAVVTWTVMDAAGGSVSATQAVVVADTTPPALSVPGPVTRTQSSNGGRAAVDLGTASASDSVDAAPVISNDAPADGFPVGTTTVTWTATDASGNSRSATQTVTITAFVAEYCEDLVSVFADDIYPLLDETEPLRCSGCHTGAAPLDTPNNFAFPNAPPTAEDFDVFRAVASIDSGGASLVLLKSRGGLTHTGGDRFPDGTADPDYRALEEFVNRATGCEPRPSGGTEKVVLGTPYEQLHRIVGVLASRPPSDDEVATIAGAADQAALLALLDPIIDGLLNEETFYERVVEMYNDLLLTDQYARSDRNVSINFGLDDFAARDWYESNYTGTTLRALREDTNYGIARAPLELIRYILRNDRPFTEILTAQYTMVNPYSAVIYGVTAGDPNFPF
ncbi:MAG TPA: HYR domain-containing protein, partial [Woeseiaceae bacterium]|nr:HYR domain-containing protein [Woeseiaceae bacterium]